MAIGQILAARKKVELIRRIDPCLVIAGGKADFERRGGIAVGGIMSGDRVDAGKRGCR